MITCSRFAINLRNLHLRPIYTSIDSPATQKTLGVSLRAIMFKSSLRQAGRTALPIRSTSTPSIATAPLSSCTHQRRHSSSKRPVPPNNGSPEVPTDVKEVSPSATKTESKDVTKERPSRKKAATALKAAEAGEAQNNWTSSMPRVPSLHHLSPKGKLRRCRSRLSTDLAQI